LEAVSEPYDGSIQMIDSSSIGVHQHAANAQARRPIQLHGRSRGGLTIKIHALLDACRLPIALKLTKGQAHNGRSAQDLLGTFDAGQILLADRSYDSNALREIVATRYGQKSKTSLHP
jgi:hypothetical protein